MEDDLEKVLLHILLPSAPVDKKSTAVQYLLEMTGTDDGCCFIKEKGKLLEAVLKLLFDDNAAVRENARKCTLNLTANEKVVLSLLGLESVMKEVTVQLLQQCLDPQQKDNMVFCILNNMTREPDGAVFVASIVLETPSVGLPCFVNLLCILHTNKAKTLCVASMLLMNLTQVPNVRHKLMTAPSYLLLHLLPIISFSSALGSCRGIVGTVKNCCFEYDFHEWLLSEAVDLLPRLLMPLAGPDEFDEDDMERLPPDLQYLPDTKQREADPEMRGILIQAVHKLCSTKTGRLKIKEKNTYVILRELHKWETSEENVESILKVIDILISDEPQEGMENLHSVQVPPHLERSFLQDDKNWEAK
ncbi:protein HGH1 homolog isoform X2 [Littorina saxatilis]|uniref:Protein HGH1 homolog n=2 Tax=Littorina saxatilis TaxID=31220 RepID=A0AAN9AJE2_9CAEN